MSSGPNEPPPPAGRLAEASRRAGDASRRAADLARLPARSELFEDAAEASRVGLRTRQERVIATARPILQTAVAAAAAWFIAKEVLGHQQPFFAPVSAVITLGLAIGERRRRAVELAIGVAVGIAIADLLVAGIGTGTWQIGVTVALAMFAATLVGGGPLLASQAAASAVLVATMQAPDSGFDFTRALDALVGAGTALVIGSLLLPPNPMRMIRGGAAPVIDSLAEALVHISAAVERRDGSEADQAIVEVSRIRPYHDDLEDALAEAADTARLSIGRREALDRISRLAEFARHLRLAMGDARSLARGVGRAIAIGDATPAEVGGAISELAESTRALHAVPVDGDSRPTREGAVRAAGFANAVIEETGNLSALHIVGQIRMIAVDLLRASGTDRESAQETVRTAVPVHLTPNPDEETTT